MTDISLLGKDQVLALVNEQNPTLKLTYEKITFGEPVAASGEDPERNTELVITGIPGHGYKNSTTLKYNRINLADFETQMPSDVQIEGESSIQNILNGFNEFYGANLQLSDVRSDLVPPNEITPEVQKFTLIASAGSYAYRGQVILSIKQADIDLEIAVTKKVLDGLTLKLT